MESKDSELINLHRTFFWQSEKFIKSDNWDDLDELFETLPSDHMHVSDKTTMSLIYADPLMREAVGGFTREEIHEKFFEELPRRVDLENFQRNVAIATEFVQRGNKHEIGIMFQHMNLEKDLDADFEWYVSFMKLSDKAKGIFTLDFKVRFLDKYQNKFMKLIALDEFVHNNMNKFQELTAREVEVMTLLAKGLSNQEIADQLSIARFTVDTHRKNIMNKLEIKRFVDLIRFAEAFDLV
ncbi:response regulator transcription factor [Ekhidna sp.]|uniref:response regulator transcription factor n=1 Tax=Ekhidna sp. TaxID=2608089 RepID=UPI003C7E7630